MLMIIEILFFIMGIYAIIAAKLPSWFVGKGFVAEGSQVRVLGLFMAIPFVLGFCAGAVIGIIDISLLGYVSTIEILSILIVSIVTVFVLRKIRKQATPPELKS